MKMGVKEFRDRIAEVAREGESVEVTHHGRVIGDFIPRRFDLERARAALKSVQDWQADLRAKGIEPEDFLAEMGLDPWGAPMDDVV